MMAAAGVATVAEAEEQLPTGGCNTDDQPPTIRIIIDEDAVVIGSLRDLDFYVQKSVGDTNNEWQYTACIEYVLPEQPRIAERFGTTQQQLLEPNCVFLPEGADRPVTFPSVFPGLKFHVYTSITGDPRLPILSSCHMITGAPDVNANGFVSMRDVFLTWQAILVEYFPQ